MSDLHGPDCGCDYGEAKQCRRHAGAPGADCEFCLVLCERCGSEGRIYQTVRPRWTEPYDADLGECGECKGTGFALIKVEPITMEDLGDDRH